MLAEEARVASSQRKWTTAGGHVSVPNVPAAPPLGQHLVSDTGEAVVAGVVLDQALYCRALVQAISPVVHEHVFPDKKRTATLQRVKRVLAVIAPWCVQSTDTISAMDGKIHSLKVAADAEGSPPEETRERAVQLFVHLVLAQYVETGTVPPAPIPSPTDAAYAQVLAFPVSGESLDTTAPLLLPAAAVEHEQNLGVQASVDDSDALMAELLDAPWDTETWELDSKIHRSQHLVSIVSSALDAVESLATLQHITAQDIAHVSGCCEALNELDTLYPPRSAQDLETEAAVKKTRQLVAERFPKLQKRPGDLLLPAAKRARSANILCVSAAV